PLAAVPPVLDPRRRARRPLRSEAAGANRHGAVHLLLAGVVGSNSDRQLADVARRGATPGAWLCRRVLGTTGPGVDPRHRGRVRIAFCRPPDGDLALFGAAGGTGSRRTDPQCVRSAERLDGQCGDLPAAHPVAHNGALWTAL